jgi:hypothetical protein
MIAAIYDRGSTARHLRILLALLELLILTTSAVSAAGGWYLVAPGLSEVLVRTRKNVGLGDIPLNTWETMEAFDTASECKARRRAVLNQVPNPGPTASDLLVAGWARLQMSECVASDDPRFSTRPTR